MDSKSKRIGTFKEFLKEQKKKVINESKISIEVDWWDECIVQVMQDLEDECGECYTTDDLYGYVQKRFTILGRKWDEFADDILIFHIKDLIYQHHGDSFVQGIETPSDAELHTKAVVIEELANVIWIKVMEKTNKGNDTIEAPITKLVDKEQTKLIPMKPISVNPDEDYPDENCEDLPWEYCSERKVKGYKGYTEMLEEAKSGIYLRNGDELFEETIDKIITEVGALKLEDIQNYLNKKNEGKSKAQTVYNYIWKKVLETVNKKAQVDVRSKGNNIYSATADVMRQALKLHTSMIVDDIMTIIKTESGLTNEKIK